MSGRGAAADNQEEHRLHEEERVTFKELCHTLQLDTTRERANEIWDGLPEIRAKEFQIKGLGRFSLEERAHELLQLYAEYKHNCWNMSSAARCLWPDGPDQLEITEGMVKEHTKCTQNSQGRISWWWAGGDFVLLYSCHSCIF